jgi:hypothetical protein
MLSIVFARPWQRLCLLKWGCSRCVLIRVRKWLSQITKPDFSPRWDDSGRAGLYGLRKNVPARITTPARRAPGWF